MHLYRNNSNLEGTKLCKLVQLLHWRRHFTIVNSVIAANLFLSFVGEILKNALKVKYTLWNVIYICAFV